MKDVKCITLEDGNEYYVVDELIIDGILYYYFVNMEDDTDVCVRKQIIENNQEYISMLNDEKELTMVLEKFLEKHPS